MRNRQTRNVDHEPLYERPRRYRRRGLRLSSAVQIASIRERRILRRKVALMSVVNGRGNKLFSPRGDPTGFASRPKVCTGPAMRFQTTVDLSLIRGLVTRIDRCSSGGFPMSKRGRRSRSATCYYFLGFPHRDLTAGAMHAVLLLMCRTLPLQIV